jgi:hypothetical protein
MQMLYPVSTNKTEPTESSSIDGNHNFNMKECKAGNV